MYIHCDIASCYHFSTSYPQSMVCSTAGVFVLLKGTFTGNHQVAISGEKKGRIWEAIQSDFSSLKPFVIWKSISFDSCVMSGLVTVIFVVIK